MKCFAVVFEKCIINKVYFISDVCVDFSCSSLQQPQDGSHDIMMMI